MTIAEIAKIREQDPVSTCFDLIYEEGVVHSRRASHDERGRREGGDARAMGFDRL